MVRCSKNVICPNTYNIHPSGLEKMAFENMIILPHLFCHMMRQIPMLHSSIKSTMKLILVLYKCVYSSGLLIVDFSVHSAVIAIRFI